MKILMSAFSCGPGRGSEPGVGWNMAVETARLGHEVTVLTQSEFRAEIEREITDGRVPPTLHFDIFMPAWLERIRDWGVRRGGSPLIWQPVNLIWQFLALRHVRQHHRDVRFDLIHHVTFAQVRWPTLLTRIGLPTVLGPLGGGERVPMALRKSFPWRNWLLELLRDLLNGALTIEPITRMAFGGATLILLRTKGALRLVPDRYRHKSVVKSGMAIAESVTARIEQRTAGEPLRLIYAGVLTYYKGVHLALRALARVRERGEHVTLTVAGDGPARKQLTELAQALGIGDYVTWRGWVARQELLNLYTGHHAFLFPSLRDAAPTVIVEAWAHGLPTVCFALGGPAEMVDTTCGRAVAAEGLDEAQCVEGLAGAIEEFARDENLRRRLAAGALTRYRACTWPEVVASTYTDIVSRLRQTQADAKPLVLRPADFVETVVPDPQIPGARAVLASAGEGGRDRGQSGRATAAR